MTKIVHFFKKSSKFFQFCPNHLTCSVFILLHFGSFCFILLHFASFCFSLLRLASFCFILLHFASFDFIWLLFFLAICVEQIAARDQPSSGHERERKAKGLARARIHIGPPEEAENPYCLILVLSFLLLLLAILCPPLSAGFQGVLAFLAT